MTPDATLVYDRDGQPGTLDTIPGDLADDGAEVGVRLASGQRLRVPAALLAAGEDGVYHIDLSFASLDLVETQTLREVEERLDVRVDTVEKGRVRATRRVETREETVDVPTWHETVQIEHVEINEYVDHVQPIRQDGDVTIVPVYEEVLVVEKRLLLKEEVRFTRQRTETRAPQRVALRRSHVDVERIPPPSSTPSNSDA